MKSLLALVLVAACGASVASAQDGSPAASGASRPSRFNISQQHRGRVWSGRRCRSIGCQDYRQCEVFNSIGRICFLIARDRQRLCLPPSGAARMSGSSSTANTTLTMMRRESAEKHLGCCWSRVSLCERTPSTEFTTTSLWWWMHATFKRAVTTMPYPPTGTAKTFSSSGMTRPLLPNIWRIGSRVLRMPKSMRPGNVAGPTDWHNFVRAARSAPDPNELNAV